MNLQEVIDYMDDKYKKKWERLPDNHPDIILMQTIANKGKAPVERNKRIVTEEEKNYIRLNQKDKTNKELATHLKMSVSKLAEIMNEMGVKKYRKNRRVEQLSKEGKVLASFKSVSEAGRKTGFNLTGIRKACLGEYKTSGGYRWRYEGEDLND